MTATATRNAEQQEQLTEFHELHVDTLATADDNIREVGDVAELTESIKANGLIEPIIATTRPMVADDGGGVLRFVVVAGHRRLAAAKLAGLEKVPVILRSMDEQQRIAAMLVENLQREDLTPLEEARAYKRLADEFELTQHQLAGQVGKSQGHISKRLALLELPAKIQGELDSGGITLDDARELSRLAAMPKRLDAAYKQGKQWRGQYARAVDDQLDEHKLAEKLGKATQELKQTGITVVAYRKGQYGHDELPKGVVNIASWEARELKLTLANHKNQPCHAAAIDPRDGSIVYVCTKPASHKGKKLETPADEKEKARKEREAEKRAQLRARESNLELGRHLAAKLAAPKIDETNMRLLAAVLMHEVGSELAQSSFLYTHEASQTVITKKDGTISRVGHVEGNAARKILDDRLAAATTPEEIMGVLLQALLTSKLADRKAVPASRRYGHVTAIGGTYGGGSPTAIKALDKIAAGIGKSTRTKRRSK